jgi:hypothetical protein
MGYITEYLIKQPGTAALGFFYLSYDDFQDRVDSPGIDEDTYEKGYCGAFSREETIR